MVSPSPSDTRKRPPPASAFSASSCTQKEKEKGAPSSLKRPRGSGVDVFIALLADSGCTLCQEAVLLDPRDGPNLAQRLERRLLASPATLSQFVLGFQEHASDADNFRRMLIPLGSIHKRNSSASETLMRVLLSVPPLQTQMANILLEKLPEYISDAEGMFSEYLPPLKDSIPRLILSQIRWLDFLVDSENLTKKLMEILSICPLGLKKEIISLLPEIIGEENHKMVVTSLEQMLQEDMQFTVPVLDAFSNLNLEETLLDQVVTLALASLRSANAEDLASIVRFLLQSANTDNVKRIVCQLRENLQLVAPSSVKSGKLDKKMKSKASAVDYDALVLEAVRSGLRFQHIVCEALLKDIRGLSEEREHKSIDFWLLLIIYVNGGTHQKVAEALIRKKVVIGHFGISLLRECIHGRGESFQDYFHGLISISETLLACKEIPTREFAVQAYVLIFEEFTNPYHRQEVLGSLVTHTGSSISFEIGSALDALVLLSYKYSQELFPFSSFLIGILDFLEGFNDSHLHQVYKFFSHLALAAWALGPSSSGASIANELLIVVRKQIANPNQKYKRMGIIAAIGLASCLSDEKNQGVISLGHNIQKSRIEEALTLLQVVVDTCQGSCHARAFLYDELVDASELAKIHFSIVEWISKQTNEFENLFLADLDDGKLPAELQEDEFLQGELWMNLDGSVSPILVNILTLLTSQELNSSQALIFLPSIFSLLASIECMTNQGSLGGIDALLGCPLYLPKYQLLTTDAWNLLPRSCKEKSCLALFYGINWIKELVNAFSTQLEERNDSLTQATREEISLKLLKRLRNLVFLEHLLDGCIRSVPSLSLPVLHSTYDTVNNNASVYTKKQASNLGGASKRGRKRKNLGNEEDTNITQSETGKVSQATITNRGGGSGKKLLNGQKTLHDVFGSKSGDHSTETREQSQSQAGNGIPNKDQLSGNKNSEETNVLLEINTVREVSEPTTILEGQRWKFRPLKLSSLSILSIPKVKDSPCCSDPASQLPLYLYLLRDLDQKLECLETNTRKQLPWATGANLPKLPSGLGSMSASKFFRRIEPHFPSLRKHLESATGILNQSVVLSSQGDKENNACDAHWDVECLAAGNPENTNLLASRVSVANSVFIVVLRCLSKMLANTELNSRGEKHTLKMLLSAFGSPDSVVEFCSDMHPSPCPGSVEYLFCSTYAYLDEYFGSDATNNFKAAFELLLCLRNLVTCAQASLESSDSKSRRSSSLRIPGFVPYLQSKLSVSAGRVLKKDWEDEETWKNLKKGDSLQQLLQIFLRCNACPIELLEELACNLMPKVPSGKTKNDSSVSSYPTLCPATFTTWYRVQLEEVLNIFNKVVKDITILHKARGASSEDVDLVLDRARQCVTILVSLINLTRIHDKAPVHAAAVKYGGKFVDTFLKGTEFLQAKYEPHKDSIIALVKELQKATRTIQTLCSEAKGMQRMPVACKVPAVKRSMERYVFYIKALLHGASQGTAFWMGNLKHKNLKGEEVGSQLPASDEEGEEEEEEGEEQEAEEMLEKEECSEEDSGGAEKDAGIADSDTERLNA